MAFAVYLCPCARTGAGAGMGTVQCWRLHLLCRAGPIRRRRVCLRGDAPRLCGAGRGAVPAWCPDVAWQSGAGWRLGAAAAVAAAAVRWHRRRLCGGGGCACCFVGGPAVLGGAVSVGGAAAAGSGPNSVMRASANSDSSCTMRCTPKGTLQCGPCVAPEGELAGPCWCPPCQQCCAVRCEEKLNA